VGLDVEHTDQRLADHDLQDLVRTLPAGSVLVAATHWALGDRPHVALSVELVDVGADLLVERLSQLAPRWSLALDDVLLGDAALQPAARRRARPTCSGAAAGRCTTPASRRWCRP